MAFATQRWERRLSRRGAAPVLDLALLRRRSFLSGLVAGGAFMYSFASFMFTLTLLLQGGLGLDALEAGLVFSPMGVSFGLGALNGRRLVARYGLWVVLIGSLLIVAGLGLLIARLAIAGGHVGIAWIIVALIVSGCGNGLVLPSLIGVALATVEPPQAGAASGIFVTAQQFAGSLGVASVGAIFFSVLGADRSGHGYAVAMAWAAGSCIVMALVVTAVVTLIMRAATATARGGVRSAGGR